MLSIRNLKVSIGPYEIINIERLDIPAGRRVGLVGESGSGKSMTAMSIAGLQPRDARLAGSITFEGRELVGLSDADLAKIRGRKIGFIPQDPTRALNPTTRIGKQMAEALRLNTTLNRRQIREKVLDLLRQVQLPDVEALVDRFPHQISGGQQQRVLIAMAIAANPTLLIADEPTTALDVTVQNEILRLIVKLSQEHGMALLFVSHELGVVRSVCDDIGVVYGGQLVEFGTSSEIVTRPLHRYTEALIGANPGLAGEAELAAMMHRRFNVIEGTVPSVGKFPDGCRFRNRCGFALERCATDPVVTELADGHRLKCWNPVTYGELVS
jgi:peptide/nickel transport system ATP-binding protein